MAVTDLEEIWKSASGRESAHQRSRAMAWQPHGWAGHVLPQWPPQLGSHAASGVGGEPGMISDSPGVGAATREGWVLKTVWKLGTDDKGMQMTAGTFLTLAFMGL